MVVGAEVGVVVGAAVVAEVVPSSRNVTRGVVLVAGSDVVGVLLLVAGAAVVLLGVAGSVVVGVVVGAGEVRTSAVVLGLVASAGVDVELS